ncbi:galactokinase [Ferruginibacter profundus]
MKWDEQKITERFCSVFNITDEPVIVRSPGRINIIGEHTDYNDGFVLPAAIDKSAYVAIAKRNDTLISLYAEGFKEHHEVDINKIEKSAKHWPNYILGTVDQLQKTGAALQGFNLLIDADIPIGAGLSSSAAVECATAFALNELFALQLTKAEMAHIAQKAEHEFAGVNCGVMDMFTSLFGKKDHVINLDCRSLLYEYVPLDLHGYKILLLNTNVKHQLSSSEYNTRRKQCEQGVSWVQQYVPQVKALRDVTVDMLDKYVLPKDKLIYRRCKYVVDENNRLLQACNDLKKGDITALGKKMFETHEGLSHQYEVSCKELDFLVDYVKNNTAVIGARMMGGGFGGCTINLVKETEIEKLVAAIQPAYQAATGLELTHYVVAIENGTELVTQKKYAHVLP